MYFVRRQWLRSLQVGAVGLTLGVGCQAEEPDPTPHDQSLRVSEEVFRMFCMRVAREENPASPDGQWFDAACNGKGATWVPPTPRLSALLERRPEVVSALDQVFAEGEGVNVPEVAPFADGELQSFLASLIPFYDDLTLPKSTRALSSVATKLLDPADVRGQRVLETLARLSPRAGYRAPNDVVAAVRPMLKYPRMDQLSQELLGFVGEGGPAHDIFVELLKVAALELAEPPEVMTDDEADKSTLRVTTELLFEENEAFKTPADPAKYFVRRDNRGWARREAAPAGSTLPTPFPVSGRADSVDRSPEGFALVPGSSERFYEYKDANRTLLAALLRDQKPLLERMDPNQPSPLEKLLRGLRPLLGPTTTRVEEFRQNETGVGRLNFMGPNVEQSPLMDLFHAFSNLLRYPETDRLLAVLQELLDKHESDAAGPVYAGLAIDARADSDAHSEAVLVGVDGQKGTPQEFWDDLIAIGMRMAERPGLFKDVIAEFGKPEGAAQTRLLARFMKHKDEITYNGAPITLGTPPAGDAEAGCAAPCYTAAQKTQMNGLVEHELAEEVMRVAGMTTDVGMNRSLFQRLMSTIQGTNGAPNCNKQGAFATVSGPLGNLRFPNADSLQMTLVGCPVDPVIGAAADYPECSFVEQPNGAETHMRSIIARAEVALKDSQLVCAAAAVIPGIKEVQDIGHEQEVSSQIDGFTLEPTPESIARFMYAPRTKFVNDLFGPMPTIHGVQLTEYEPNLLFALEMKDSAVQIGGAPQSFLDVSAGLTRAFDDHEVFEDTANGEVAADGYMFADLLSVLHMHWSSRKPGNCPVDPVTDPVCTMLGLTGSACNAGCTQSLDPDANFYAKQTNLVSYEPLLIAAFEDERLGDILASATARLATINLPWEDGVARDGVTVLAEFVERVLKPDETLSYYSDKQRKYAKTNTCTTIVTNGAGQLSCGCPAGSQAVDANVPDSDCVTPNGAILPRGKVLPQTTPMHLVLDALNRFDAAFADPANMDRRAPWRQARSVLVDTFLTANRAADPMDPNTFVYSLANPRARPVGIQLVSWLRDRIELYRAEGNGALESWANGLPDRLASVLGHPLLARGLDLLDQLWLSEGPAREMALFNAYLLDPNNAEAFAGVVLAAADTLELVDRDRELSPAIQFAALTIADNAFAALDGIGSGVQPDTNAGTALRTLEVTRKIADLNRGKDSASAISRLLKNAVLPNPQKGGKAPLETIIDAIADVNRADLTKTTTDPHTLEDNRKVFEQLNSFLSDEDRGLERLYNVIEKREIN